MKADTPRRADTTLLRGELRLADRLDARFFALLRAIADTGSLNKGARAAGYSYKGAWLLLETAHNLAHAQLVATTRAGSTLTPAAHELLAAWHVLAERHAAFLHEQEAWLLARPQLAQTLRRLSMKTSARNQFAGTVTSLQKGPATTLVSLRIGGDHELVAAIASASATRLKLKRGSEAIALIKASEVVLVTDFAGYVLSARNQLAGTVARIEKGAVSSIVVLTLPGGSHVTASVTNDAVSALGLAVGQPATAAFKAYAVMLAVAV